MEELQWYLEKFLDYPFSPETDHADRVQKALVDWGHESFKTLFEDSSARHMLDEAIHGGYSRLHLQISSDDPRVLAWPWEALRDPQVGVLAHACQMERRLKTVSAPQPLPRSLPTDRLNILMVVARPGGRHDVRFRSIARPLIELVEKERLPAHVEILRPPTFDQLLAHLRERHGFYHILHFDGHGSYSADTSRIGVYAPQGKLVFETEDGHPDPITAEKLSVLLKECDVPAVVLNACQSAMMGGDHVDPFSTVATALLRAGIRNVVAMSYSLYVSGAQQFLPSFYRRLFEEGDIGAAVRAGRQQMSIHDKRVCARGEFPLQDWLLPVLYRHDPSSVTFVTKKSRHFVPRVSQLRDALLGEKNRYGFVGRDGAILEMERAMRRPPAGILIHGLGGVGKTTLARGFLQWLDQTGGLEHKPFWFSFQSIYSAEYVFNRLGEALFGNETFALLVMEKKIKTLADRLQHRRFLIVWDNFESPCGISGTAINANLPDSDRGLLAQFLDELRGGPTKVIITSRSPEDWLGATRRFMLKLGGLDREERWEYCNAILRDLRKNVNRNDKDLVELTDLLNGHPLAMRAILPWLETRSAAQLLTALRSNLSSLRSEDDEDQSKLDATLAFVAQSLPQEMSEPLTLVGMHDGYLNAPLLLSMVKQAGAPGTRQTIEALMRALVAAGLIRGISDGTYELHPLLTSYLRTIHFKKVPSQDRDLWARVFTDVMANWADSLGLRDLHEKRIEFALHSQNFHYALGEAVLHKMWTPAMALTLSLATFSLESGDFLSAANLSTQLAEYAKNSGRPNIEIVAYHKLGVIAQQQSDFLTAKDWYFKSLAISERIRDERSSGDTYHQLGTLADQQRDFSAAEAWYLKSLAIEEKYDNQRGIAISYHQLGFNAQEQRNFPASEQYYLKSLAIKEHLGDWYGIANTCHQLGVIAELQHNLGAAAAKEWLLKALAIRMNLGDEQRIADTYHQLGMNAHEQTDLSAAKDWYLKSLQLEEKNGNNMGAALSYHQLGMLAQQQGDLVAAEQWYQQSLAIKERLGDEHGVAGTRMHLGILASWQGNHIASGRLLIESVVAFHKHKDPHSVAQGVDNFIRNYRNANPKTRLKLRALWHDAGLGELPSEAA